MSIVNYPTVSQKKFRVAEIFGPTIQGEGRQAGLPCYFIRFGGCDLRCSWCDTPHAVLPEQVAQLPLRTVGDIIESLKMLPFGPRWVVVTGGNPALLQLDELLYGLKMNGYMSMVETQGTVYSDWISDADEICISPKPPSSGNEVTDKVLAEFLSKLWRGLQGQDRFRPWTWMTHKAYLKIVVFDDDDYEYAKRIKKNLKTFQMYLSAGNEDPSLPTVGRPYPSNDPRDYAPLGLQSTTEVVLNKFKWLTEKVMRDPEMQNVRVLPQLHTLIWGNERGH